MHKCAELYVGLQRPCGFVLVSLWCALYIAHVGVDPPGCPLPIAVADSPTQAASPDPQRPRCCLLEASLAPPSVVDIRVPQATAEASCRTFPSAQATGQCRDRAHGTSAAHCRLRFADRSSESRSTAAEVRLQSCFEHHPTNQGLTCHSPWAATHGSSHQAAQADKAILH